VTARQWAGVAVLAAAAWMGLSALEGDDQSTPAASPPTTATYPAAPSTPVTPAPPAPASTTADATTPSSTSSARTPSPEPTSTTAVDTSTSPSPAAAKRQRESGRAVTAAVAYLRVLGKGNTVPDRRRAVIDLVVAETTTAPPFADADPVLRVSGPGQVLAIDETNEAAVVQLPTQVGAVFLEMRRVNDRWLVAGLPAPD
jgi:hypothetical protein